LVSPREDTPPNLSNTTFDYISVFKGVDKLANVVAVT
jgi:hypothetical protein